MSYKKVIITIDSSTSSSTGIAWDVTGNLIFKSSKKIKLHSPKKGYYEQDSNEWIKTIIANLKELSKKLSSCEILSICITNQRETFVPVDSNGKPLRPAITWMDERCKKEVTSLSKRIGHNKIVRITGKNIDIIPSIYKIEWIRKNESKIFKNTYKFLDVQSLLVWFLTGNYNTSWASADSMGMFDVKNKHWSELILKKLKINKNQLPNVFKPGQIIGKISTQASKIIKLNAGIPIISGGGDGQSAFMGSVSNYKNTAFLNLGTSVNSGIHSKKYYFGKLSKVSLSFDNKGYILENPIKAGTFSLNWYLEKIIKTKNKNIKYMNNINPNTSIKKTGLFFLPYLLGVMGPYWDSDAKGILFGITGNTSREDIYSSIMETIGLEIAFSLNLISKKMKKKINKIIIIGGGAQNNEWCQIFSNITGFEVHRPENYEGTSLGVAILSLKSLGYFKSYEESSKKILDKQKKIIFKTKYKEHLKYQKLIQIYKNIYLRNKDIFSKISSFLNE